MAISPQQAFAAPDAAGSGLVVSSRAFTPRGSNMGFGTRTISHDGGSAGCLVDLQRNSRDPWMVACGKSLGDGDMLRPRSDLPSITTYSKHCKLRRQSMKMKVSLRTFMTRDDVIFDVSSFRRYCVEMLVAALLLEVVPRAVEGAEQSRTEEYSCQYAQRLTRIPASNSGHNPASR
ncbi:hypothetical protein BM1_08469 [Bipolaris maydis]|nr:hypothetical protein BM1_08469 [Bipolaris maydis]